MLEVRKTSSAVARIDNGIDCSVTSHHWTTNSRVIPARQPSDSGGVSTWPSTTTKTLLPVPSQRLPSRLPSTASLAPAARASAKHTAFSAYDVVFRPASGERSLRGQRLVAIWVVAGQGDPGMLTHAKVVPASPRPDPSGPGPRCT